MTERWRPALELHESAGRCRLSLGELACGHGHTLQEAADDLVARLQSIVLCIRSTGFVVPSEGARLDPRLLDFLWELGETVARGGDVRAHVVGAAALEPS